MPDAREVVDRWLDAFEARDTERIIRMMADDVVLESEMLREPIRGRSTLQHMLEGALDAYESIRVERRKVVAADRDVALLLRMQVRFADDVEMFDERLSTAGKELSATAALFVEVNEAGEIARVMRVRDTLGIMRQLGLSPDRMTELVRKFEEATREPPSRAA